MRSSEYLLHELLVDDNPTSGRSLSRCSNLVVDRTNHQSWEADNGSLSSVYSIPVLLIGPTTPSSRMEPVDKVPCTGATPGSDRSDNSLGGLVEYPASPREIPQESLELLDIPPLILLSLVFGMRIDYSIGKTVDVSYPPPHIDASSKIPVSDLRKTSSSKLPVLIGSLPVLTEVVLVVVFSDTFPKCFRAISSNSLLKACN
ncbi:hypothetical protein Tco_1476906 [Tanacetum coccineum]